MRASKMFAPTLREVPAEAEIVSHQLMLRAGMLRKVTSGMYTYLPLAWRTMKKIEDIIREEMDAKDCQELMMPIAQPAEIWQESGRWDVYGAEMWRVQDRHGRDFCLGPTHEELITITFRNDVRSYKQLPQRLYQIQSKFRDERRPRFGLMRGREFVMKDCYSFDRDIDGLEVSYRLMYDAYTNIFSRCGLNFRPVEADSGAIGGSGSQEFMALADTGESAIVYCDTCDYAASVEIAGLPAQKAEPVVMLPLEKVLTPNCKTSEDVANFLQIPLSQVAKSMHYMVDGKLVIIMVRGDRRINDIKLQNILGVNELVPATEAEISAAIGGKAGYLGPVGVPDDVRVIIDCEVAELYNCVVGANEEGYHLQNVNLRRGDYRVTLTADLREVNVGEPCPHCHGTLLGARGIEVGQIFKLYDKYSKAMSVTFTDENGDEQVPMMGCYGIGVGRTMAAVIEQCNDADGIIWPMAIAPYQVVVVPVSDREPELVAAAEDLYAQLQAVGCEVVLDDRKERPGVKFKDADLIGYPLRVTVGAKSLARGMFEVKIRATGEVLEVAVADAVDFLLGKIKEQTR